MDLALICPDCDQRYLKNAGHCRGGRWGGCCSSFGTNNGFDAHRIGDHDGERRCLTVEERLDAGWVQTPEGFWRSAADERKAEQARLNPPTHWATRRT